MKDCRNDLLEEFANMKKEDFLHPNHPLVTRTFSYPSDEFEALLGKNSLENREVEDRVRAIINKVRTQGDEALIAYAREFDKAELTMGIKVTPYEIKEAYEKADPEVVRAIRRAKENIWNFHKKQKEKSWLEPEEDGTVLGMMVRPLQRVGVYVPGGTASYPSSVLMNVVPAKVAGVPQIVMVTPPRKDGALNPYTLVAAQEAGVTEIYKVGGAQAIAALAYGTQTIKRVDKITGPGNIYVTLAKKAVYGQVDIDMLAGPSEILVLADEHANPAYVAADMLSQAEHDVMAAAILVTPSETLAAEVMAELEEQLNSLPRKDIAEQALRDHGAIILVKDIDQAIEVANRAAPEHLEVLLQHPFSYLGKLTNAGAVFLGPFSPEPVGDYYAGPNHVLPTGGTARFYSPLNVGTFMKKTSVIAYSAQAFSRGANDILRLAEVEGLDAHANAVKVRLTNHE